MSQFILVLLRYLVIMIILAVIGFCGGKVGIMLRKKKDAKLANPDTVDIDE